MTPHLQQRPVWLESSGQSPPPPRSEEGSEQRARWWRSLFWNKGHAHRQCVIQSTFTLRCPARGVSPDVRLLSGAAGFGDGGRSEAPPLPHGARHLGIQLPHEDAAKTAKTVNSTCDLRSGMSEGKVVCDEAHLSPDTVMRCLQSWLNLIQVTISENTPLIKSFPLTL